MFETDLAEIKKWMETNQPDFIKNLGKPLHDETYLSFANEVGIPLPPELLAFISFFPAPNSDFESPIFQLNFSIMNLDDMISTWRELSGQRAAGEFDSENWWQTTWIPFLHNGAGDYFCVDLMGSFGGQGGQIIRFLHNDPNRTIEYASLKQWLAIYRQSLEKEFWQVTKYGIQKRNDEQARQWFAQHNPGFPIRARA